MKTAVFLFALVVFAVSLPVQAATIGGIEIAGIAQAGEEGEGALKHYYDNYLTSGRVVNAFGVIPWMGRPFLSGLPIHFNQAGRASCAPISVRIPRYDRPTNRSLVQTYGRYWFHHLYPDDDDFAPDFSVGTCRQGLTVQAGTYLFTAPDLGSFYDDGISQIIFAGIGTLSDGQITYPANIFLTTEFDTPTAPYQMLIRAIDPSLPDAPPLPPAPVPLPPAGPLALLGLGLLAGAGRRPRAGQA